MTPTPQQQPEEMSVEWFDAKIAELRTIIDQNIGALSVLQQMRALVAKKAEAEDELPADNG